MLATIILTIAGTVYARNLHSPDRYIAAAFELSRQAGLENITQLQTSIPVYPSTHANAPLAQYQPAQDGKGMIAVGSNLVRYHREYMDLRGEVSYTERPDFDQYMTILTLLSLGNESAHVIQHRNGSLDDFYRFRKNGNRPATCSLYALQQHVSDIAMLSDALRLEYYFLGQGSVKGINALRFALEKMNLRDLFEEFRNAYQTKDSLRLGRTLDLVFYRRLKDNMASLSECNGQKMALLAPSIYTSAVDPARDIFPKARHRIQKRNRASLNTNLNR